MIEPDYIDLPPGNDDHPPADMANGQEFVNRIVQALIAGPQWGKTLLIITYDEHGGFYDHQKPPTNAPPLRGGRTTLGPRVPTFLVSPWIKRQDVIHSRFDHTSIGATILRRFAGLTPPPSVSARLDAATDLREALSLTEPRPRSEFASIGLPTLNARRTPARRSLDRDASGSATRSATTTSTGCCRRCDSSAARRHGKDPRADPRGDSHRPGPHRRAFDTTSPMTRRPDRASRAVRDMPVVTHPSGPATMSELCFADAPHHSGGRLRPSPRTATHDVRRSLVKPRSSLGEACGREVGVGGTAPPRCSSSWSGTTHTGRGCGDRSAARSMSVVSRCSSLSRMR